jgi:hypothetical protein
MAKKLQRYPFQGNSGVDKIKKEAIMKTDKVSFGTRPLIGDIVATKGLPKYKQKLTEGIFDAFEKLSKNGIDDQFSINIGPKRGAKKLSRKDISKFIIDSYEKLTKSNKQTTTTCGYPKPAKTKVSKSHSEKIEKLLNLFGFDDWTRA